MHSVEGLKVDMNVCSVVLLSSGPVVNKGMVLKYYKGLVRLLEREST